MDIQVRLHGFDERARTARIDEGGSYLDLLGELDIPSESVLVFVNDEPVPVDDVVNAGADVRIVRIVSGGCGRR